MSCTLPVGIIEKEESARAKMWHVRSQRGSPNEVQASIASDNVITALKPA